MAFGGPGGVVFDSVLFLAVGQPVGDSGLFYSTTEVLHRRSPLEKVSVFNSLGVPETKEFRNKI